MSFGSCRAQHFWRLLGLKKHGWCLANTPILLLACSPDAVPPVACEQLQRSLPSIDGAATLGTGSIEGFLEIEDGATLELALGIQGGWMVTPRVRLDAAALGAGPDTCVRAASSVVIENSAPIEMNQVLSLTYDGDLALSQPIFMLLSFDLDAVEGRQAQIQLSVEGPDAGARASVRVLLVNSE